MYGVTYRWRADGSDADLLPAGDSRDLTVQLAGGGTRQQRWHFPSRSDCRSCHNDNAGRMLGLKTHQLNGDFFYLATGRTDNQLRALNHIGLFSPAFDESSIANLAKAVHLNDAHASLESRVRSYADSNCALCHRPNGVAANFDARFTTTLADQKLIRGELVGAYTPANATLIQPADLTRSIFHRRDVSTGPDRMPPLGRTLVDERYRQVLEAWIGSMPAGFTADPTAGPAAPIANNDSATVDMGASVSIPVLNNDSDDGNSLYAGAITVTVPPGRGTVSLDAAAGSLVYTHDGSASTSDSFRYTVSDPRGNVSAPALVSVTVVPPVTGSDAVADYPFDIDFTDASGNGNHLSASGSPQLVSVPGRSVVRFRKVGDRLSVAVPDSLLMPGSGEALALEVTMRARAFPAYGNANAPVVSLEQAWDTSLAIGQGFWDEAPHVRAGDRWILDPDGWLARVPLNTWKTVRIDFDGDQTFTLSIDGTSVSSVQWQPNFSADYDWQLVIGNFDGDIDSVRIIAGDGGPPVDTTPPAVNLTAVSSSTTSPIPLNISFSEDVSGLSAGDFVVTNGTMASLSGSGGSYSAAVSALAAGPVTVSLPAGAASDAAGNASLASNLVTISYQPPTGGGGGDGDFDFGTNLNTNLAAPYQAGGMTLSTNTGGMMLSYTREAGVNRTEVLEASVNLSQWIDIGSPTITNNGDGTETVSFVGIENISPLTPALGFVRLRVQTASPATTTRTLPLGWYRVSLTGTQSHGLSLVNGTAWSGTVSGVATSTDVELSGDLPSAAGGRLYLEVLDGSLAGHRFDIDAAGSSINRLRLDLGASHNTRSGIDSSLEGARVAVRRHWTMAEAFPTSVMTGGANAATADKVLLYRSSTNSYTTYYLHQGIKWVRNGDAGLADQGGLVIAPGSGVFVTRAGSAGTLNLTHRGEVRANAFAQPLSAGRTFVAAPFPLSLSPTQRVMTSTEVFIGGSEPDGADGALVWNGSSFDRYFLWENWPVANYWRRAGFSNNENNTKLFDYRRAAFITTLWGQHPNYVVPVPWVP